MNFDIKDVITLSDNIKYVVVGKINYENDAYCILSELGNVANIKFLVKNKERETLIEVEDKVLIQKLLSIFYEQTKEKISSNF